MFIDDGPSLHSEIVNLEAAAISKAATKAATTENIIPKSNLVDILVASVQTIGVPEDIASSTLVVPSSASNNNHDDSNSCNDDLAANNTRNNISSSESIRDGRSESTINHATYVIEDTKKYFKWSESTNKIASNGTLLLTAVTVISILVLFYNNVNKRTTR